MSVGKVIYYWNLHSPPHGLNGAVEIINDLDPDMLWYAHWVTGFPMPPDVDSAYSIARRCGFSANEALKIQNLCKLNAYTLTHIREQVKAIGNKIYCPCILTQNLRIDFNFDPITFDLIPKEKLESMALDYSKWNLPYDKRETQELMRNIAGLPEGAYFPDITSPDYQDYLIKKIKALKSVGVKAVWLDMLFTQANTAYRLTKSYDHSAVKEAYLASCKIVDKIKSLGMMVGHWFDGFMYPYSKLPNSDFVTKSPSEEEVLHKRIDQSYWHSLSDQIARKKKDVCLLIVFDFGPRDYTPLAIFSQELSSQEQCEFLTKLHSLAEDITSIYIPATVAYPVHGPGIGANPKKLAWGKYNYYDALAPEFNTYECIKTLLSEPETKVTIELDSSPSSKVYIDGVYKGKTGSQGV